MECIAYGDSLKLVETCWDSWIRYDFQTIPNVILWLVVSKICIFLNIWDNPSH